MIEAPQPGPNSAAGEGRQARYIAQTTEQFAALGRFVQAFEQMVWSARQAALHLFRAKDVEQQRLLHIMLGHAGMTAKPVFDVHRAFYGEFLNNPENNIPGDERQVISAVLSYIDGEVNSLTQMRNALLHGTWFIGWASEEEEDFSEFTVHKWKTSANGLESHGLPKTAYDLDALSARCTAISKLVNRVWTAFVVPGEGGPAPRVRFNVHRVGKAWLPEPPPVTDSSAPIF